MKPLVIILIALVASFFAAVYVFIPDTIQVTEIAKIRSNEKAANRSLINESKWKNWWPSYASNRSNRALFSYNNYYYKVTNKYFEGVEMEITKDKRVYSSFLRILPLGSDSSLIDWRLIIKNSSNPFSRINKYMEAGRIKGNMKQLLRSLISYLQNSEKLYGIKIENERVKDTLLISTKMTTKDYPSIIRIYSSIDSLRTFINSIQAKETNYPMLHVRKTGNGYETMVAIPVNRLLESNRQFVFKRMVPGNILVSEVNGGVFTVQEARREMNNYVEDNELTSPAIPFESLITDRLKEKDTSKWITKLYYPIL